ncbi:RsmB/NOP family class I SAM-dependent RNA methyltransferase [Shewanella maritima]|uniref:RsmB/NOP family class I SAM-dependent RNA methyltransferase n=1 Tax=Shewanella maritima TaxID=2520507 RepID=UPI0037362292
MTQTHVSQNLTAPSFVDITVSNGQQKRALSYATTVTQLFTQIMNKKMPADRCLAEYFREHKKHGSKDRKVIRESLFSLFRWWGWLKQLGDMSQAQDALLILSYASALEQHPWLPVSQAWLTLSGKLDQLDAFYPQLEQQNTNPIIQTTDTSRLVIELQATFTQTSRQEVVIEQLVPAWFWEVCPVEQQQDRIELIQALSTRPPIWARAQRQNRDDVIKQLDQEGLQAQPSEYFSDALNLGTKSINFNASQCYQQGLIEIQDLGSQVIGQICQPQADEHWWDTCSGAGGKTLQLRSLMQQQSSQSQGRITASDIRRKPLEELHKRAKRAKFNHINTAPWQSDVLPVSEEGFDGVLVDAPCSCIGTWRRNPDMRWLDDRSCVDDKASLQLDILTRSAKAVKLGGKLVYATCSLSPIENQQVVDSFLQNNETYSLQTVAHPFTQTDADMLTVWPQQANCDGMFVAVMKRNLP